MSLHPGPDARIFREFPAIFITLFWEYKWSLVRIYKTKLTLEMQRKHLKDILR